MRSKAIILLISLCILPACSKVKFTKPENPYENKRTLNQLTPAEIEAAKRPSIDRENSHLSVETLNYYKEIGGN